jgi:hypothetical protein
LEFWRLVTESALKLFHLETRQVHVVGEVIEELPDVEKLLKNFTFYEDLLWNRLLRIVLCTMERWHFPDKVVFYWVSDNVFVNQIWVCLSEYLEQHLDLLILVFLHFLNLILFLLVLLYFLHFFLHTNLLLH